MVLTRSYYKHHSSHFHKLATGLPRRHRSTPVLKTTWKGPSSNAERLWRALSDGTISPEEAVAAVKALAIKEGKPPGPQTDRYVEEAIQVMIYHGFLEFTKDGLLRMTQKGLMFRQSAEIKDGEDPHHAFFFKTLRKLCRLLPKPTTAQMRTEYNVYRLQFDYAPLGNNGGAPNAAMSGEGNTVAGGSGLQGGDDVEMAEEPDSELPSGQQVSVERPNPSTPIRNSPSFGNNGPYRTPVSMNRPGPSTSRVTSPPASPSPSRTGSVQQLDADFEMNVELPSGSMPLTYSQLQEEVSRLQEEVSRLQEEITKLEETIRLHDESIAQKDRHIEALERQLGVSDAEYQRFKDERDAEDALAQQHRRRAAELREQQAAIGEEQAAIDKAADERFEARRQRMLASAAPPTPTIWDKVMGFVGGTTSKSGNTNSP